MDDLYLANILTMDDDHEVRYTSIGASNKRLTPIVALEIRFSSLDSLDLQDKTVGQIKEALSDEFTDEVLLKVKYEEKYPGSMVIWFRRCNYEECITFSRGTK